jgi:hypothetical protein
MQPRRRLLQSLGFSVSWDLSHNGRSKTPRFARRPRRQRRPPVSDLRSVRCPIPEETGEMPLAPDFDGACPIFGVGQDV